MKFKVTSRTRKPGDSSQWRRDFDKEHKIKQNLIKIIYAAYKDESPELISKFRNFNVYIFPNKECSSVGGTYYHDSHTIRIYNFSEGPAALAGTTIHELSHHIDLMRNGCTGHQKPFYEEYRRLLWAAFDIGQVPVVLFRDYTLNSIYRDKNKVLAMVDEYIEIQRRRVRNSDQEN